MSLPSSDRFNILDYNYRSAEAGEGEVFNESIFNRVIVPNRPVEINGDGLQFHINHSINEAKTEKAVLYVKDSLSYTNVDGSEGYGIPEDFTLEFDILLTDSMPRDFGNKENRLFVGAINAQGYTAGLLFSHQGIALAAYPEDPNPVILGGSYKLLVDQMSGGVFYEDGINFRVIVNGQDGRVTVYSSPSKDAYDEGSKLTSAEVFYAGKARETGNLQEDMVVLWASGETVPKQQSDYGFEGVYNQDITFFIRSLRVASGKLIPEDAPIAIAKCPPYLTLGERSTLRGIDSHDPNAKSITYNWEIEVAPKESRASLDGSSMSTCGIKTIWDYDGSNIETVRISYVRPTSKVDGYVTRLSKGAFGDELSMEFDDQSGVLTVSLKVDSDGNVLTTSSDFVAAFMNRNSPAFDPKISGGEDVATGITYPQLFRADLAITSMTSSAGSEKLSVGNFAFSGGSGSTLADPGFIADKPGVYVFSLQVDNGSLKSRKVRLTCTASSVTQLVGHRPNSKYIFKYLPDFWNLVQDKDQIETIWSAVTQVISNEMLQTWQNDYAKSLKDISRQYQRRWLSVPTCIELDDATTTTFVTNPSRVNEIVIPHVKKGFQAKFADSAGTWDPAEAMLPGLKLVMSSVTQPYVVNVTNVEALYSTTSEVVEETVEHHCEGIPGMVTGTQTATNTIETPTGYYRLTVSGDGFVKYRVVSERSAGYFIVDPEDPNATSPITSSVLNDETYPLFSVDPNKDIVRVRATSDVLFGNVVETSVGGVTNSGRLSDLNGDLLNEHSDGIPVYWDHLRLAEYVDVHTTPYIELSSDVSVPDMNLQMGDLIVLSFIDPYSNQSVSKGVPVLTAHENCIFLEWQCLIDHLNNQAVAANDSKTYTGDDINLLNVSASKIIRTRDLEPIEDLVSASNLGFNTIVPEFNQSVDFDIEEGQIRFTDLFSGLLTTVEGSDLVKFESGYERHQEITEAGFEIIQLAVAGVHSIQIKSGPDAGFYRIQNIDEDTGYLQLDRSLTRSLSGCSFSSPRFSLYVRPTQDQLWSELSYFDNWETVQNNFGLFVGLPKDLVDKYDPDLDYLSVIKSMWFAFLSGPSFGNVGLAVQSLFGLPFSEAEGRVILNEPPSPDTEGRLLLIDNDGRVYTYHYPYGSDLATNPRTGRQIKAYGMTTPEEYDALTQEQFDEYADSCVDAYTRLVDVVKVGDYISDPELIEEVLSRNDYKHVESDGDEYIVDLPPSLLQKYHTFVVDVPLQVARKTAVFPLISDFIQEAKPAYTNFILRGSLFFSDEINAVEEMFIHPTILLKDTPHTSPFFSTKLGEDGFGQPAVLPNQELKIWPVSKTYEKFDLDFSPILDAANFCLSGPFFAHFHIQQGHSLLFISEDTIGTKLGRYYVDTNTYEWHPIIQEIMESVSPVAPFGGVAIAVPGTADFEVFAIGNHQVVKFNTQDPNVQLVTQLGLFLREPANINATLLPTGNLAPYQDLNCLFFKPENFPPPMPLQIHWDDEDVKEKFESGYCEGVLDDFSGDGSWNMRRGKLDQVNTVNSDIDVVRSRQWVRINHRFDVFPAQRFFEIGETISLVDEDGDPITGTLWDEAPPVVLHVGYGENPKLPHVEHPAMTVVNDYHVSYIVIGFEVTRGMINSVEESDLYDYESAGISNYGHEERLDVIRSVGDDIGYINMYLRGNTSGASANAVEAVDRNYRTLQETIWQTDKLIENGPASDPTLTLTAYFPADDTGANAYPSGTGGLTITKFRSLSETFDPSHDDTSSMYQWEYQEYPPATYPPASPDTRMVPSFNPGFYTGWDLNGDDPAVEKVVWGYKHDGGSLVTTPTGINDFARPDNFATSYLQNVHMGMKLSARKDHHVTHGFTNFRIPRPSIKMILPSSAGYDLRICGFYFCNDDPSRVSIPTGTPSSFGNPGAGDGVIGGSWVFFRNSETLEEIGEVDWSFETGVNLGEPILPKGQLNNGVSTFILGSADQPSDGHVIECHIPALDDVGYYDIIIRNYRPYLSPGEQWGDPSTWVYHMDETVAHRAYYHDPGGHGGISWGTDPFGTGGNN